MPEVEKRLKSVSLVPLRTRLMRVVPIQSLFPKGKWADVSYLFTSGRENRYNLSGTDCLYLSHEESTALAEFRRQFRGLRFGDLQPVCLYFAEVDLARVLDLSDSTTRRRMGVTLEELESEWGYGLPTSLSQRIGEAASRIGIMGIRYRSVAAAELEEAGTNVVIFKRSVCSPSSVKILGPKRQPLEEWP